MQIPNSPAPMAALLLLISSAALAYDPPPVNIDWPVADGSKLGWQVDHFDRLEAAVAEQTYKRITSVLVLQNGSLAYERYFGDGEVSRLNDMRSATKTVTSLLVGAAIAEGLIQDVQAPAFSFFPKRQPPANPDPRKGKITIEDLLTMSSLLECNDDNAYSSGNEERMYVTEDWIQFVLDLPIKGYAPWDTKPSKSPYGRSFSYCTAGTFLTGAIVEAVTGQSLGSYADKVLHKPLGITQVTWPESPLGVHQGGGGTRYRSRDIAKLGELARLGGRWQGRQVIPESWIQQSTQAHVQAREGTTYGYQWWRMSFELDGQTTWHWAMAGNGGNYVFVYPASGLVTVITATAYGTNYMHSQSQAIYSEMVLPAVTAAAK